MSQRGGPPQRPEKDQKNREPVNAEEADEQLVARIFAVVRNGIPDYRIVLHDITVEEVRFAIVGLRALKMFVDAQNVYAAIFEIRARANSKAENRSTVDKFKEKREEKRDKNDDSDDEEGGGAGRPLLSK